MSKKYPEPSPSQMRRIAEDVDKKEKPLPYFESAQTKLHKSIIYYNPLSPEPDLEEFRCPAQPSFSRIFQTTQACKGKARGQGCEELKTCPAYQEQKKLEKAHPEIDWENICRNPKEKLSVISLIKKGAIINP